ncbi:MAG: PEP-CTERM sorting domain-containing protein [Verrucomicrobia bacterium]|nr:PEP-CTERM sorting domain-containing protein [Verrucomicrobiota bacterium]MCH8526979.1 PEP-CTERM sorting domain-containing protein [Kiritimatiellia bacterium]
MVLIPEPGTLTLVGLAGLGQLASRLKRLRS